MYKSATEIETFTVDLKQEETLFSVVGVLRCKWELWELCPARQKLQMDMTKTESDRNQGKTGVNGVTGMHADVH